MRRWLIGGLVGMGLLVGEAVAPLQAAQSVPTDEATLLRELAERLVAPPYPGPSGQPTRARLLPGQLPPDLPLALPMPPDSRLIGSAVRGAAGRTESTDVVLDALGSMADIVTFYHQALAQLGWSPPPFGGQPGGFQATVGATTESFCQGPDGPSLMLTVASWPPGPSSVQINVDPGGPGPCAPFPSPGPGGMPGANLLPRLHAPQGVQLRNVESSGGDGRWRSEATAETTWSAADLEAAFAQQFQARGWNRQASGAQGPMAWSIWGVPGEGNWQGSLTVLEALGGNLRYLTLRVDSLTPVSESPGPMLAP